MKPFLSVVIPTCGRPSLLDECLNRLHPRHQSLSQSLYEVIVTDDSPDGSTKELMRTHHPDIRWCKGPSRGPAANRNCGAALASGSWLVFLDDDCIPSSDLLESYYRAVSSDSGTLVFEGRISPHGKKTRVDQQAPINETGGCLWSCNFCISREFFAQLRGFDENFPVASMEDIDLRERILEIGEHIDFLHNASVLHPWLRKKGCDFIRSHAASLVYFCNKHGRQHQLGTTARCRVMAHLLFNALVKEGWRYGWRGGIRFTALSLYSVYSLRKAVRKHAIGCF